MTSRGKARVVKLASKIRKEHPGLDHGQAIERAKEVLGYGKVSNVEKAN